jgi:hypothetical protein
VACATTRSGSPSRSRLARLGGLSFRDGFPIFHTADLERAVRFYVELIGCEEVFRYEDAYVGLTGPVTLGLTATQTATRSGSRLSRRSKTARR